MGKPSERVGRKATDLNPRHVDKAAELQQRAPLPPFESGFFVFRRHFMLQITGTYNNYITMSNLLSPLGVKGSSNLVVQAFSMAINTLEKQDNQKIFSKESSAAMEELYNQFAALAGDAQKLTTSSIDSVFNDRTATSSDSTVVTATALNAFAPGTGAAEAAYNISVDQLAVGQENAGQALNTTDSSVVNLGNNSFNVQMNGQDYLFSVDVAAGDTNEDVLLKMETTINGAGIGVTASIVEDSASGTQQFTIVADETGAANSFTITDVSGNAVASTGIDAVSTASQDAAYSVDGSDYTSGSNTVYLDDGLVTATLEGVGTSTLTVAPDHGKVTSAVTNLVSELNKTIDFLDSNSSYIKDDLVAALNSFISDHKNELASFGITLGEDGKLGIDSSELATAVSENLSGIKEAFSGLDGLALQTSNLASNTVMNSPLAYAKEAESLGGATFDSLYSASANILEGLIQGVYVNLYT